MNRKIIAALFLGAATLATSVATTHADPPAGSGWDKNPDVVIGGGSDTTYLVSQRLETLFNGAPGCSLDTGNTVTRALCLDPTAAPTGPTNGNYDHDVFASAAAIGSGAGVTALIGTGQPYHPAIDYARSSRGPSGTEANLATFWGYARDGIAVTTFGSRTGVSLTKQDLVDIYTCVKTDWSQFGQPAGTIIPWDMNAASGTRASFYGYIGVGGTGQPVIGTCVRKLNPVGAAAAIAPFENDVKPLLADSGPDLTFGTADDDENNYLWWISFGDWITYPFTANGNADGVAANPAISSNLVTVDGTTPSASTIFNSTYAIMRTLFQVTRNTDADCVTPAGAAGACNNGVLPTVFGNTTAKGGAVREFTQFLCRTSNAQQATNPVTGRNYRVEINSAIAAEGFQTLSATVTGLRTAGYSCQVLT
jgi:ABC-type phosphate transport system substrate-binding protein